MAGEEKISLPVALVRASADVTQPMFVTFEGVEIEAAICTRETYASKTALPPEDWSVLGAYVLSGSAAADDCDARAYPGTTQTRPLLERIDRHLGDDESWWRQAILIRRLVREFDNSESGYLETLLHNACGDAAKIELVPGTRRSNFKGPRSTDTKADIDTRIFGAVKVALRLGGLRLETEDELAYRRGLPTRHRADEYR
jgi:hypothetical protein